MDVSLQIKSEVLRRRTFAIISHPDAGKTTLTEKLLLYGGAIRQAGAVRAKAHQAHTTSDWMEIERQRGISISTSVMPFEYRGYRINLLDTPGHRDFSEDTYRTLMAADAVVMLIDGAKGVESQTRKLFEVCRMRGLPIFTFVNKLDRPSRDPLGLIDEIEEVLKIRSCPMTWPIGSGDHFRGVYDRQAREMLLFEKEAAANVKERLVPRQITGVDDPDLPVLLGRHGDPYEAERLHQTFREELDLLEAAGDPFDEERVRKGELTLVFFGSAMNNFGVERFLERFIRYAPCPGVRHAAGEEIPAELPLFSGFVFKIQANTNPLFRDRIVHIRVCSGRFSRGMSAIHARLGREFRLSKAFLFFGRNREMIEEAWPGDIVGVLDTSREILIGDTLSEGRRIEFEGVPQFAPEHFATVSNLDPMRRKQLKLGMDQLTQEGVVQIYHQPALGEVSPILGAVGELQFEVFKQRIETEYGIETRMERLPFSRARWVIGPRSSIDKVCSGADTKLVRDRDGSLVVLFKDDWSAQWAEKQARDVTFLKSPPLQRRK